ncbi:uroporphyrinogen decarboxylase family protein [Halostagnicola bangensis]
MSGSAPNAVAYLRGRPTAERPFIPIIGTLAASIDQVPPDVFLSDPTRLANGLQRAQRLFDLDAVCVVPDPTLVADGLGASAEWDETASQFVPTDHLSTTDDVADPNEITDSGRVPTVLEASDRLATSMDDVAVFGVLPGPHTTFETVFGERAQADDERMKPIRTATGELARAFGRNGVDGFLVIESPPRDGDERGDHAVSSAMEVLEVLDNIGEFFGTVLGLSPGGYPTDAVESIVDATATDAVFLDIADPGATADALPDVRVGGAITPSLLEADDGEIERTMAETVTDLPTDAFIASGREVPADTHPRKLQTVYRATEKSDN